MSENIYYKLGERLNQFQMKLMLIEPFLNILREIYTEEEAELCSKLPPGSHTAAELAGQFGQDEKTLTGLLETMADKGVVFVLKTDEGVSKYALTPFVPGVVEFQLMRGTDTPHDRKVARMFDAFMEGDMADLMKATLSDPKVVKELIPIPPARTVTVQQELPQGGQIYPYEKLIDLVEQESFFAAAKCYCRHHTYLLDNPCKVEGVPELSCLMFGKMAEFIVDRGFGKEVSKEKCLEILKATEEAGLVHNTNNFIENTVFVCNCCGCCCGFLKMIKSFDSSAMLAYSNFKVQANVDECTACEDCIERCQMEALSLADDLISIKESRCIGCGNCVSVCPVECLSMVRRAEEEPPSVGSELAALGI